MGNFFSVKNLVSTFFLGAMGFFAPTLADASAPSCGNVFRELTKLQVSETITALAKLKITLDEAKIQGSGLATHRVLAPQFNVKENEATALLRDVMGMSKSEITEAIRREILRIQNRQSEVVEERDEQRRTQRRQVDKILEDNYLRENMVFHFLSKGKVQYNNRPYPVDNYFMMATMVTQKMWASIWAYVGEKDVHVLAPGSKINPVKVIIRGIELELNPYHPIDRFNKKMMDVFLVRLNELSQSRDEADQAFLRELIPDHQPYDIYDLPTNQQWEYMRTNMGQSYRNFFDRDTDTELSLYAWKRKEDSLEIQPIAMLQPRMINGKAFYDIEGNALEFTKTLDPQGHYIVRGLTQISEQTTLPMNAAFPQVSFRLIRLRPPF